jgi:hypothetical protein
MPRIISIIVEKIGIRKKKKNKDMNYGFKDIKKRKK